MFNGSHIPSRVKKIGEAACAAVASAALLLAYASPALAQNTANGITETGDPNSAAASQTANPQAADSDSGSNSDSQSDTSADSANDSTNSADANAANGSSTPQLAPAAAGCDSVQDWAMLSSCMSQSGTVTIATKIDAGDSIVIPADADVTLTAKDGLDSSINAATAGNGVLIVNGKLTIGADAKDANFTYKNGKRWLVLVNNGGRLTVNNGVFSGVDTADTGYANGGVIKVTGGSVIINNGTFVDNKAETAAVLYADSGTIAINDGTFSGNSAVNAGVLYQTNGAKTVVSGGTFENNKSTSTGAGGWQGGGVLRNMGGSEMTVAGGEFIGNSANKLGGVVFNGGTLSVSGGTFKSNVSYGAGGGVIAQPAGSTTVTGGTFTENAQEFDVCTRDAYGNVGNGSCRNDAYKNAGGGAIHTDGGDLTIQGEVTFSKNHANAAAFMTGGGAIYAHGNLWVFNDALDSSKKPTFTGNWTAVGVGDQNTQYLNDDTTEKVLPTGGAGGAIFLQGLKDDNPKSIAYFMGGVFEGNTSGYLGGAVYTEENTTAFMGKAVAESNVAGHFGGGLWLCPSGQGAASEGGNIALLNNSVNSDIDSNRDNHGEQFEAGADFAMMNPKGKDYAESTFKLLNTWFMDRSESAVNWYWDGTPQSKANGFADKYQDPNWGGGGFKKNENLKYNVSRYDDDKHPQRFSESAAEGSLQKEPVKAPSNLVLINPGNQENSSRDPVDDTLTIYTGIALKAQLTDYGKANGTPTTDGGKSTVWNNAAVRFTNNAARLSGGAFGTNGVISFSTPYSASWDKVAASDANSGDTNKEPVYLDGSVWTLRTQNGGMLNEYLRPLDCQNNTAAKPSTCWHEVTDADESKWLEVDIRDGGIRDTNPQPGKIGVENLKPGTYLLKEKAAPNGYHATTNVYTFTIDEQKDGNVKEPTITLDKNVDPDGYGPIKDNAIGNSPMSGSVSWSKNNTKDDVTALQDLPGSEWAITKLTKDGKDDSSFANLKVADCVLSGSVKECPETQSGSKELKDSNDAEGRFTVDGLLAGDYKLVETKAPDGYQQPDKDTYYTFTIDPTSNAAVTLTKHSSANDTADTEVDGNQVANTPTEVSWKKVDIADDSKLLSGTEWTIIKLDGQDEPTTDSRTVTDCTNADCAKQSNTKQSYVDKNPAEGHFTVRELTYSSTPEDAKTQYKLVETKAQDGYAKPDPDKTYAIITIDAKGQSSMTLHGEWNTSSNVATTQCLAQKPATQSNDNPGAGVAKTAANATATAVARIAARFGIPAERRTVVPTAGGGETTDECTLTNAKLVASLPFTGGTDARTWLLIGGVAAVAAAIILALINEYRKRKGLA